jgi:hypothetical protein
MLAVLVALAFGIGLILHIVSTNAYGQEQQQQQQNQTATKTHLDLEGVYSIKYPAANWTLMERTNRFEDKDLTLINNRTLDELQVFISDVSDSKDNKTNEQLLRNLVDNV